jgi:hypothetical protein
MRQKAEIRHLWVAKTPVLKQSHAVTHKAKLLQDLKLRGDEYVLDLGRGRGAVLLLLAAQHCTFVRLLQRQLDNQPLLSRRRKRKCYLLKGQQP